MQGGQYAGALCSPPPSPPSPLIQTYISIRVQITTHLDVNGHVAQITTDRNGRHVNRRNRQRMVHRQREHNTTVRVRMREEERVRKELMKYGRLNAQIDS